MDEGSVKVIAIATILLLGVGSSYYLFFANSFTATQTGFNFKGCINHGSLGSTCTSAVNFPLADSVGGPITSISINASSGSFTYNGTPNSWAFNCAGTVNFGNGVVSPIAATAFGQGAPPSSWPVSVSPNAWSPSAVFGTNYGQKNVTAVFGSKTSPCQLSVNFAGTPNPIIRSYGFAKKVSWSFNYQSTPPVITTSTVTVTSTTVSTSTSTGTSVTSSASNIWTTTATSATNGVTGNQVGSGAIMTAAPYSVQGGRTVVWFYLPAGTVLPSCNSGFCGQVSIVTNSTSVSVFGFALAANSWTQVLVPVGTMPGQTVIGRVDQGSTNLFDSVIIVSPSVASSQSSCVGLIGQQQSPTCHPSDTVPPPYDSQYYAWWNAQQSALYGVTTSSSSTSASSTSSGCPFLSPSKCLALSIVSVTF